MPRFFKTSPSVSENRLLMPNHRLQSTDPNFLITYQMSPTRYVQLFKTERGIRAAFSENHNKAANEIRFEDIELDDDLSKMDMQQLRTYLTESHVKLHPITDGVNTHYKLYVLPRLRGGVKFGNIDVTTKLKVNSENTTDRSFTDSHNTTTDNSRHETGTTTCCRCTCS